MRADRLGQRLSAPKTITRGRFRLVENLLRAFRRFTSFQIIILGFAGVIVAGALLLMLPAASAQGAATPFTDALFTSTSAVCVTGLVVRDSGSYWSPFGQSLILLLIQIGGLGVITMSATFLMLAGRNISLKERSAMQDALSAPSVGGIVRLTRFILKGTFIVELTGALVMLPVFWRDHGFRGIWMAVFHSVSAFCNAGFDVLADVDAGGSLCRYATDPVVNFTIMALIIIGGLGFAVWGDIRHHRRFSRLSVYSRLVVIITTVLIFGGAGVFAALEWNNPNTIGELTVPQKLMAALFQSVTLRTAGFATFDQNALSDVSKAASDLLMLVGGSSGSTAGGVKTATVGVILLSAWSTARGRTSVHVMKRRIPRQAVENASALFILVLLLSGLGAAFLSIADHVSLENALYETISALCTVGLTTGITSSLGTASQIILIVLMFFGRLGIMTISVGFMAANRAEERVSYAETKIMIG